MTQPSSPKPRMPLKTLAIVAVVVSLAAGGLGAGVGALFGAPAYFGFFFGFTLAGLGGMFALANRIAQMQEK